MEVQPQLMLLQKTLMGIEGLGRSLYPDLNLWDTAKPFLEKWLRERKNPINVLKNAVTQIQPTLEKMIETPHLAFDLLKKMQQGSCTQAETKVQPAATKPQKSIALGAGLALLTAGIIELIIPPASTSAWWLTGAGAVLC